MITKKFKEEYAKLNPKQKEAVDTIEGPVMVVAGPGTGKTTILTLRIANILLKRREKLVEDKSFCRSISAIPNFSNIKAFLTCSLP